MTNETVSTVIDRAVAMIRQSADRKSALGTIGKQISTLVLPADPELPVMGNYHTGKNTSTGYVPDLLFVSSKGTNALKDITYSFDREDGGVAFFPRVGRNQRCPCGSRIKSERCNHEI